MKTCPWCAEQIQDAAVKCPHCQSLLVGEKPDDKVLLYVDLGLIRFAKFASAVLGLFLIVGAALYGFDAQNAHKQAYEAQAAAQNAQHEAQNAQVEARKSASDLQQWVAAEQRRLSEAQTAAQKAQQEAEKAQNDAQKSASDFKQWADERTASFDKETDALKQKLVQIYGRDIDIDDAAGGDSLVNLARSGQGIQANVDDLEQRLRVLELATNRGSESSAEVLDTLTSALRVEQTSSAASSAAEVVVKKSPPSDFSKKQYDLKFSVCTQQGDQCGDHGLDAIEKVIYRLDPKWFSNPNETRSNRAHGFSFRVRVWGVTTVTACIYLKGRKEPVVRRGQISLTGTQYWAPDPFVTQSAASSEQC